LGVERLHVTVRGSQLTRPAGTLAVPLHSPLAATLTPALAALHALP
jgi:hypothetical protein